MLLRLLHWLDRVICIQGIAERSEQVLEYVMGVGFIQRPVLRTPNLLTQGVEKIRARAFILNEMALGVPMQCIPLTTYGNSHVTSPSRTSL